MMYNEKRENGSILSADFQVAGTTNATGKNSIMIELIEQAGGRVLEVHMSGKLTRTDYRQFLPEVEKLIHEHGKISMLVFMQSFHGWDLGAAWMDFKFALRHYTDLERIALIGETKWQRAMMVVCKPFTMAHVRSFDSNHADDARIWIQGEQESRAV